MDINTLANDLYENSRKKGFYDFEDSLRNRLALSQAALNHQQPEVQESKWGSANAVEQDKTMLTEHFGNRLMLIAGEAVEAHEELRSGRNVGELYFSAHFKEDPDELVPFDPNTGKRLKPEGVLMELVDVGVRTLETIAGILAQMTPEQKATLRGQVPQSVFTERRTGEGSIFANNELGPVTVAELFMLKANYNAQRAAMHGRQF